MKVILRLLRCRRGVSALEFALAAPFLCAAVLLLVDLGMGVGARMELDRNLRAGVQAAMTLERSAAEVGKVVRIAAGTTPLDVTVTSDCQCGLEVRSCDTFCARNQPPSVFFAIRASRAHPGPLSSGGSIVSAARVQVR